MWIRRWELESSSPLLERRLEREALQIFRAFKN